MKLLTLALFCAALATLVTPAAAQLSVDLTLKRHSFITHEPMLATVTINNRSGRDIVLADTPQMPWFSFEIAGEGEHMIPPRNPNYALDPLEIKAGGQMRRSVNLNTLYEIGEFGVYHIRANIFFADMKKFFSSKPVTAEVTEGRLLWKQTVGAPGGESQRTFSLLAHQQGEHTLLYVRVEDRDSGVVYCTNELGRLIEGQPPTSEFDAGNNLYVLQLAGQREYLLTKIGINGEFCNQSKYSAPKTRPFLRRLADGKLQIVGGRREDPLAAGSVPIPVKLSNRPPGFPGK